MRVFRNFIKICLILLTVALGGPVWADAMTCEDYAEWYQDYCGFGEWDKDGGGSFCKSGHTCWVNLPGLTCNSSNYLDFLNLSPYCLTEDGQLVCVDNTFYSYGVNAEHECHSCADHVGTPYRYHFECTQGDDNCTKDYCYATCAEVQGSGYEGIIYYGSDIEGDGCTYTGSGPGGGGEDPQKNQIVSGTCSGATDDAPPDQLESSIDALTQNCPDWDSKGEFNLEETLNQMKDQCGLGEKGTNEYWSDTKYAKVIVCSSMNVGACLLTPHVPMSWECVTKDCPSGWTGKAYGNNCSNCSMNCSPNGLGEGIELATEGTISYGAYCSNEPEKTCGYKCAKGFYGTATSATTGCTKCPENATCDGGNNSTFVCKDRYYKAEENATKCTFCPDNAVCEEGKQWVCKQGFYKDGEKCTGCPEAHGVKGTTSANGATDVSKCYAPANNSTWKVGEDSTGYWEYYCVQNASYVNQ